MSDYPVLQLLQTWPREHKGSWSKTEVKEFISYLKRYIAEEATKDWLIDAKRELKNKWDLNGFKTFIKEIAPDIGHLGTENFDPEKLMDMIARTFWLTFSPYQRELETAVDKRLEQLDVVPEDIEASQSQLLEGISNQTLLIVGGVLLAFLLLVFLFVFGRGGSGGSQTRYENFENSPRGEYGYDGRYY